MGIWASQLGLGPRAIIVAGGDLNGALSTANANGGGLVVVASSMTLTGTATIYSNTELYVEPGVTITLSSGVNNNMLVNSAYSASSTNVTLTYTSGLTCSVAWTAHGKAVGDYVSIAGVTPSMFMGVFRVITITDANNFIVQLIRLPSGSPSAVSGSVTAKAADHNIKIHGGGIWDYNYPNNSSTDMRNHAIIIGHAADVEIDIHGKNASKYVLNVGAVRNFDVKVHSDNTNSDLIKVYGPAFFGEAMATGYGADDLCTMQTKEPTAFAAYRWTYGDLLGVKISAHGYTGADGASLCGIYLSANEYADDCVIGNVKGYSAGSAVKIWGDTGVATVNAGFFGSIKIENDSGAGLSTKALLDVIYCTGKRLELLRPSFNPIAATDIGVEIAVTALLGQFVINGMDFNPVVAYTGEICQIDGTVGSLDLINNNLYKGGLVQIGGTSTVRTINASHNHLDGAKDLIYIAPSAPRPVVNLNNNDFKSNTNLRVIGCDSANGLDVNANGNTFYGLTFGIVRGNVASCPITIRSGGNSFLSGSIVFSRAVGSEIVSLFGDDLQADVTTLARTAGSHCYNTNAAAGTLGAAGLVDCDSSGAANSWKLRTNDTLLY